MPFLTPSTIFFASFLTIAFCAETGASVSHSCVVKSTQGYYSYDPTSTSGPENWGHMKGSEMCGKGNRQSPIDFPMKCLYAPLANGPKPLIASASMTPAAGSYNWALNCDSCGMTLFGGKLYKLINLHFHSPSEHTLKGGSYPLEAHMVHKADDGSLAVVATLFKYPDDNDYRSEIANRGNAEFGKSKLVRKALSAVQSGKSSVIPLGSIIEEDMGYCTYVGSLTTPPCSEGVTFMMSQHIPTVTKRQVADYRLTAGVGIDGNNRPVRPLGERAVTCYIQE